MNQSERVLRHLRDSGSITSFEAIREYGFTRLSAIIFNLKKDGYRFEDEMIGTVNRYGEKVSFKRYILKEEN